MQIAYKTKKLEKNCTDPKAIKKAYNQMAKQINQRIKQLEAAKDLSVMRTLPGARCHELKGDLAGCLAVNLSGNWRLIFRPSHYPPPQKPDGGLDWSKVTNITIINIDDYH
jgi:plasmid maintenance system killer protein